MDGQFTDLMTDIGTKARAAAAELACASSERKAAALIAAADAVWRRRHCSPPLLPRHRVDRNKRTSAGFSHGDRRCSDGNH